eukprot:151052-Chlamydomonas_euryale.AAC.2
MRLRSAAASADVRLHSAAASADVTSRPWACLEEHTLDVPEHDPTSTQSLDGPSQGVHAYVHDKCAQQVCNPALRDAGLRWHPTPRTQSPNFTPKSTPKALIGFLLGRLLPGSYSRHSKWGAVRLVDLRSLLPGSQ